MSFEFHVYRFLNRDHRKFIRFLDKRVPGWKLRLRGEDSIYQEICEIFDLEDEEGFDQIIPLIRKGALGRCSKENTIFFEKMSMCLALTPGQAVIIRLFLPDFAEELTD